MDEEFPHVITIQQKTSVPDGGGGWTEEWTKFITTEAFVSPISSKEFYQAQQLQTPINCNVFVPYVDGIKPDMRIIYGTDKLTIKSKPLDQGGQGEILMIKCEIQ